MPPQIVSSARREDGTASIELVAVVPFLLLAVLAAAQIGVVGYAAWSAGIAARAGARAELVGSDAEAAARGALPVALRPDAEVGEGDSVSVRVLVPRLLPGMPSVPIRVEADLSDG